MSVDRAWFRAVAAVVLASGLTGCKSGASVSKPSWWTFGGSNADAEKLASAPTYGDAAKAADGSITKPSAAATPYPTTTTPQGYVVAGSTAAPAGGPPALQQPAVGDAPITYGTAPPPRGEEMPPASPTVASGVAQSGPYATLPTASPAPPPAPPTALDPAASPPAARMADSRGVDAFAPPSAAQPPAEFAAPSAAPFPSGSGDSRYGTAGGSRFSGEPATAPAVGMPAAPFAAPQTTPPAAPPVAAPVAPAAAPTSLPSAPPMRRPDPGYRPGGTSSYRPSRTILVGEPDSAAAVRTAGFESPAEPLRQ
jgi:hypothetical protein